MAGEIVDRFHYDAGFISLGVVAALALGLFAYAMPETKEDGAAPSTPAVSGLAADGAAAE